MVTIEKIIKILYIIYGIVTLALFIAMIAMWANLSSIDEKDRDAYKTSLTKVVYALLGFSSIALIIIINIQKYYELGTKKLVQPINDEVNEFVFNRAADDESFIPFGE